MKLKDTIWVTEDPEFIELNKAKSCEKYLQEAFRCY